MRKFRASAADEGRALAGWLAERLGEPVDRALARVTAGNVTIDGRRARDPEALIRARTTIVVRDEILPQGGWRVVYEDDEALVVDKPAGLPSQATRGAASALDEQVEAAHPGVRLLHRLDREAAGLVLFGKPAGRARLQALLAEGRLIREYLAEVVGSPPWEAQTIDRPLGPDPRDRRRRAVVASGGERAVTHVQVERREPGLTVLRCRLETGRTHQIRVHLAAAGYPIVGDALYGGPGPAAPTLGLTCVLLAWEDKRVVLGEGGGRGPGGA